MVRHLPNFLTIFRIGLIPAFVLLMGEPSSLMRGLALIVFLTAALTDLFDGMVARRFGVVSDLGKLLDPLADKILVMSALVMMVGQREELSGVPLVPPWLVVALLAREIWITGLRGVAAAQGIVVAASESGKIKSVLQMVAIVLILLQFDDVPLLPWSVSSLMLGLNLLVLSLLFSYWAAINYTMAIFHSLNLTDNSLAPRDDKKTLNSD